MSEIKSTYKDIEDYKKNLAKAEETVNYAAKSATLAFVVLFLLPFWGWLLPETITTNTGEPIAGYFSDMSFGMKILCGTLFGFVGLVFVGGINGSMSTKQSDALKIKEELELEKLKEELRKASS
jgi:hypothetical protein